MTGHAIPEVVEAIQHQAGRMIHTSTLYLIEPQIALAEEIAAQCPWPDMPSNSISTFGGSPLTTAGALANLRYLLRNDLQANARHMGERIRQQVEESLAGSPMVGDIRGKGLMLGIEFVHPGTRKPDPQVTGRVLEAAKRRHLLIGKGGLYGNTLRVSPPLSVTASEADTGTAALLEAIQEAAAAG